MAYLEDIPLIPSLGFHHQRFSRASQGLSHSSCETFQLSFGFGFGFVAPAGTSTPKFQIFGIPNSSLIWSGCYIFNMLSKLLLTPFLKKKEKIFFIKALMVRKEKKKGVHVILGKFLSLSFVYPLITLFFCFFLLSSGCDIGC